MESWVREGLSGVLGFEVPDDLINYVMAIDNDKDFNEYMRTLLDFENPKHRSFFVELVHKKFPNRGTTPAPKQKKKISKNKQPQKDFVTMEVPHQVADKPAEETGKDKSKKKTKYVNLYSKEGQAAQVVMLKGRHQCECEATKHDLVNNCIECGRIVCTQEGSGPCFHCGNLVCTPEEERQINSNTKNGAKLKRSLMSSKQEKGYQEALAQMKKLVEFDRNSEKRTQIIDDDRDYFNTRSNWMSRQQREQLDKYRDEMHEKKHESRLNKTMTFDFAGREIKVDESIAEVDVEKIKNIREGASGGERPARQFFNDMLAPLVSGDRDVAPGVNPALLQFDESVSKVGYSAVTRARGGRVQDAALQEMSDEGKCLSMHQPWASLLVEGIKLHEGRTWYTSHRGRLWIASTAKPPDEDTVKALENQYRVFYPEKQYKFPSFYPAGCLLGCVNVDDCLAQEEYQLRYPDGESDSPYVLICSNPVSLRLRFPIKGQHKIYQLEKTIHKAAQKCIQTMSKIENEADAA